MFYQFYAFVIQIKKKKNSKFKVSIQKVPLGQITDA